MGDKHKICAACKFWESSGFGQGNCLRYPPQQSIAEAARTSRVVFIMPRTSANHWCGEYKDKYPDD